MKVSLVCTLGVSPPVVTEFVRFMIDGEGLPVSDVTVVATADPVVQSSLKLVKAALASRFPRIRVHETLLPFEDVRSEEETYMFMNTVGRLLSDQRRVHRVDAVHLCLAGGRKDMAITAALVSTYFGVNGVYHVIMPDIQIVNQRLELLRKDIDQLASADDPITFYNSRKEDFDPLMFPPMGDYTVIKIPTIPYPSSVLRKVRRVLASDGMEKHETGLPEDVLEGLRAAELVRITSKGTVYSTETGKRIHDILKWV